MIDDGGWLLTPFVYINRIRRHFVMRRGGRWKRASVVTHYKNYALQCDVNLILDPTKNSELQSQA